MISTNLSSPMLTIPLSQRDRQIAQKFSLEQSTQTKKDQVYQNTLAILSVNHYLHLLNIPTDLTQSFSWNPAIRLCDNIADLKISSLGHLECRPIRDNEEFCYVPLDSQQERIGFLVVEINSQQTESKLCGFVPSVNGSQISRQELRSLDDFLVYLDNYQPVTKLDQWLAGIFDKQWQSLETLISHQKLIFRKDQTEWLEKILKEQFQFLEAFLSQYPFIFPTEALRSQHQSAFRNKQRNSLNNIEELLSSSKAKADFITLQDTLSQFIQKNDNEEERWKYAEILWDLNPQHPATGVRRVLDLGIYLGGENIALMMALLPRNTKQVSVLLRIYPLHDKINLPEGLTLTGFDQNQTPYFEIKARDKDDYMQFKSIVDYGETFSIKVSLNGINFTEKFVI